MPFLSQYKYDKLNPFKDKLCLHKCLEIALLDWLCAVHSLCDTV